MCSIEKWSKGQSAVIQVISINIVLTYMYKDTNIHEGYLNLNLKFENNNFNVSQ